jgi:hypothetical protein
MTLKSAQIISPHKWGHVVDDPKISPDNLAP